MLYEATCVSSSVNGLHNGGATDNSSEDSDSEKDDQGHQPGAEEEDNSNAELFVLLTDIVRRQYCTYLEKQLLENVQAWRNTPNFKEIAMEGGVLLKNDEALQSGALQECCRLLEDKALKACMHARRYQRTMLKIIAEVRRSTQEARLEDELRKLLIVDKSNQKNPSQTTINQSTQTDDSSNDGAEPKRKMPADRQTHTRHSPSSLTLEQKIEMFQKRLNQETAALVASTTHKTPRSSRSRKHASHSHTKERHQKSHLRRQQEERSKISEERNENKPAAPPVLSATSSPSPHSSKSKAAIETVNGNALPSADCETNEIETDHSLNAVIESIDALEQDDEIAKELDQLFSEEKSELEELLGLNIKPEVDDPQVRSVLEEIQSAPLSQGVVVRQQDVVSPPMKQYRQMSPVRRPRSGLSNDVYNSHAMRSSLSPSPSLSPFQSPSVAHSSQSKNRHPSTNQHSKRVATDLRHSLWPCELFMQRRRLTASLSRLIEEDFRWHDIMKWKFQALFGEDSDDEFAPCSPSIELDEVLISSCIRRISPWIVKHLMKPMRDGLIANRFLFKKLAKRLAHTIVLENQYPDERLIKCAVEEYFCLHQAVLTLEDMNEMPNLKSIDDNT